jgi:GT2 family glycosyltransferase
MTSLSVIVPATNDPTTLDRCLEAIGRASRPPEQIIVVDRPSGIGPAAARNRGVIRATGEIFVFVDSDVEVAPDAFERIRATFEANPALNALFGAYDDSPQDPGVVSIFRNLLHHHVHRSGAGPATTFWAGLGAIRRGDFLAIGGFDERRFPHPSVEDIELGMRLAARGGQIELDPQLQGKHLKRWTLSEMVRVDLLRRGIPWTRLMLERRSVGTMLNLGWRHRLTALASLTLVGGIGARRGTIAAPALLVVLVLNGPFYALVFRTRGVRAAAGAVPLHIIHHLTSAAALPLGVAAHFLDRSARGTASAN